MLNRRGILSALGSLVAAPVVAKVTPAFNANQITFGPFPTSIIPNEVELTTLGQQSKKWTALFVSTGSVIDFTNGDVTVTVSTKTSVS